MKYLLLLLIGFSLIVGGKSARAAEPGKLNPEILQAVAMLKATRANRGHANNGRFSQAVSYLDHATPIPVAKHTGTSCVGAIGETLVEATNLWWNAASSDARRMVRPKLVPIEDWSSGRAFDMYGHFMQLTTLNLVPFANVSPDEKNLRVREAALIAQFGENAVSKAKAFQVDDVGEAFDAIGIGKRVSFERLEPGDFLTF